MKNAETARGAAKKQKATHLKSSVARDLECDESEDALDKAMAGLKLKTEAEPEKEKPEEK